MDKHIDTIIRAADALDSIGRRDLADALDALVARAAKSPKPRYKPGDKVSLVDEKMPLPIKSVKTHPHVGPYYEISLWVLERDLKESEDESEGSKEEPKEDQGCFFAD